MKPRYSKVFESSSEKKIIIDWISKDIKDAQFELNGYIRMRDPEMINYWRKVIEYFNYYIRYIERIKVEQLQNDVRFGDEAEQYAANIILVRLGAK